MHDKLKKLLEKINLDEEYYSYFNNGVLEKIIINKTLKKWCFKLTLDSTLEVEIYNMFIKKINDTFVDNDKILDVSVVIKYNNKNYDLLSSYYKNIIENMDNKIVKIFMDNQIYYNKHAS